MKNEIFVKNHKLTYEVHSNGKEKIIFIHGWSSFQFYWSNIIQYFKPFGECITIDLPAHFPAIAPENFKNFSLDEIIEIETEAIKKIIGDGKCILIGHSTGGVAAMGVAHNLKSQISKLILVCSVVHGPVNNFLYAYKLAFEKNFGDYVSMAQKFLLGIDLSKYISFLPVVHDKIKFFSNPEINSYLEIYHQKFKSIDPFVMGEYLMMLDKCDFRDKAKDIKIPVQIHVGKFDSMVPMEHGLELAKIIKNAELVVYENSGHVPTLEEKEKFLSNSLRFIKNE